MRTGAMSILFAVVKAFEVLWRIYEPRSAYTHFAGASGFDRKW